VAGGQTTGRYIFGNRWPRAIVTLIATFAVFGFSFMTMMPVFARDVLHLDARGYGALVSAIGAGAAVSAFFMAALGGRARRARLVLISGVLFGATLTGAALAPGFGSALVLGHNLLDGVGTERVGALAPLWHALHVPGPLEVLPVFVLYPLVPWVGVMALGFAAGPHIFARDARAGRRLALAGVALIAAFVLLRALDGYGDHAHRLHLGGPALLFMSFLNTTKYPPSLLYLLMTLGPALVALAAFRRARGPAADVLVTFGRVPFLFYLAHLYLVHTLAVAAGVAQGFPASAIRTVSLRLPEAYGFGLPVVYAVWIGVVALLYPVCRRYAELKARSRAWWLSYL
jgi:hypothetical protein